LRSDAFPDGTFGGAAPNVPQAIIFWVTEELIKYRDGATTVTTACVFDYGLRNIEEEEEEESAKPLADAKGKQRRQQRQVPTPKPQAAASPSVLPPSFPLPFPPHSKDVNISNQQAALLNDTFLHIWEIAKDEASLPCQ